MRQSEADKLEWSATISSRAILHIGDQVPAPKSENPSVISIWIRDGRSAFEDSVPSA